MSFSKQGGRSLIIAVDHLLPRDGSILDFGAGDGDLAQFLCERGLRAAAYETSGEMSLPALVPSLISYTSDVGAASSPISGSALCVSGQSCEHRYIASGGGNDGNGEH